jgi:hypothetical protein
VTASLSGSPSETAKLPLWRLIAGIAVLAALAGLLVTAGLVYVDNFLLDRYMRALAQQPASIAQSDAALTSRILDRAKELDLPVHASDIGITRPDGRPHIRIARYGVQTYLGRMDLRISEASSR